MKKTSLIVLIVLGILIPLFSTLTGKVIAQVDECANQSAGSQSKIECYNQKLTSLSTQSKTLSNQIAQFNAQIQLTTAKIAQTEEKINLLGGRIDQLEGSLDTLTQAFSSRAVETYKMARFGDSFLLLLSSSDLNQAVTRFKSLQFVQESDRTLMQKWQMAQTNYKSQKTEQETLQAELNKQKIDLSNQKKAKDALLAQTKNDEIKYQQLLAQALAEKAAIDAALIAGVKVGPIKRGDPIALVGNSGYPGCSTGKHLHFEIRQDNKWVDPAPYLQSKTVEDDQGNGGGNVTIGSGSWPWPISEPIRITQFYGKTPYSWRYSYSGGIHTGFDTVSSSEDVIRAPADGTLYKSSQFCGSSTINISYIDHGSGLVSLYLHVQ